MNVHEGSKSFIIIRNRSRTFTNEREWTFIIVRERRKYFYNLKFKIIKIFLKPLKIYILLPRMILNVHSRSFVNVRERSWTITNDYGWFWTFMNVHEWTEGSRRLMNNIHEQERRELLNDQNCKCWCTHRYNDKFIWYNDKL